VFVYKQDNVRISGLDLKTEYSLNNYFSLVLKGMIVRAWNYSIKDYLIYMPADRGDINVKLELPSFIYFQNTYFQINNQFVAKQWRAPANVDFATPPLGYYLLGFDIGTTVQIKKQKLLLNFGVTNLLNTVYREYLDRFRYYCDAVGVSYNLRITMPLTMYAKK